jgi:hypothetical protein
MTLKVHFDGKVLVPDEPVNLPVNCALEVQIKPIGAPSGSGKPLSRLLALARKFPVTQAPQDGAAQHDHYLYGHPKRP